MKWKAKLPSPAMAVALVALFVAMTGSATAVSLIKAKNIAKNAVLSKHIKNGQIGTGDLSKSLNTKLKSIGAQGTAGAQGPAGAAGPQGPKGDTGSQGIQGLQGPSDAVVGEKTIPAQLPNGSFPSGDPSTVASLNVPSAGAWTVVANAQADNNEGAVGFASCRLTAGTSVISQTVGLGADGVGDKGGVSLSTAGNLGAGDAIVLACRDNGFFLSSKDVEIDEIQMTAVKVATLTTDTL